MTLLAHRNTVHGGARVTGHEPLYKVWRAMKRRCLVSADPSYPRYGGRGIGICERWMNYIHFREDMLPTWQAGLTLDRVNNSGNYEPTNCRWADRTVQARNRRTNFLITHQGVTKPVSQWADDLGVPWSRIYQRVVKLKWPIEKALSTQTFEGNHNPARPSKRSRFLTYRGETLQQYQWALRLKLPSGLIDARIRRLGWSIDRALSTPAKSSTRVENLKSVSAK